MQRREMQLPQGWYPHRESELIKMIENFINGYEKPLLKNACGAIIPHAGWFFSGKLAAQTLSVLSSTNPDTIMLFGGHLGKEKPRIYLDHAFETPFGDIFTDVELMDLLSENCIKEQDWEVDNTVEVQLPLIKYFFPNSKIVAFRSPCNDNASALGKLCATKAIELKRKVVFIGSLDLTHYGSRYGFSPKGFGEKALSWVKDENDKKFVSLLLDLKEKEAIENALKTHSSCSPGAASSVIGGVKAYLKNIKSTLIDYYTSSDIMKDESFVGYAGIVFSEK